MPGLPCTLKSCGPCLSAFHSLTLSRYLSYDRPGRMHRTVVQKRAAGGLGHRSDMRKGEGAPHEGEQCRPHRGARHRGR